jgi:hypothetical protein
MTRTASLDEDLGSILERARAAHEQRLATPRPVEPTPDPAFVRAREIADRAVLLLEGDFGAEEVDRCRLDDPGRTPALDAARRYVAQHEKPILVLLGGVGAGKTTAATWIAREAGGARPGKALSTTLEKRGRYDRAYADWLESRTLVVLDDLGVEPLDGKGYFAALVDELVDRAYSHRRRLVITTNVAADQLERRLGERVWSRLVSRAMRERCGDSDLRRRPGATVTAIRGAR